MQLLKVVRTFGNDWVFSSETCTAEPIATAALLPSGLLGRLERPDQAFGGDPTLTPGASSGSCFLSHVAMPDNPPTVFR